MLSWEQGREVFRGRGEEGREGGRETKVSQQRMHIEDIEVLVDDMVDDI